MRYILDLANFFLQFNSTQVYASFSKFRHTDTQIRVIKVIILRYCIIHIVCIRTISHEMHENSPASTTVIETKGERARFSVDTERGSTDPRATAKIMQRSNDRALITTAR